ncbi:MAG TPA: hypothetical protein EYG21_03265, partial [Nitrospinaceae bacterium]|nr:hypothetical protein [Nitrospinaceae bacterium]
MKVFYISLLIATFHNSGFAEPILNESNIENGKINYENNCAECHGYKLQGTAHGSSLSDENFFNNLGQSEKKLYQEIISTMPPGKIGTIQKEDYSNITEYILNFSDIESDNNKDWVSFSDPSSIDKPDERKSLFENRVIKNFDDISDQDINYPKENDWTSWRRTPLGFGYSPLKQVNKENVQK